MSDEKKQEFAQKSVELKQALKEWYKEQVELEQEFVGSAAGSPATNVWNVSNRLKSVQVVQSMVIVEATLGMPVPEDNVPDLVKEGGYANFDEMIADLFPKLEKAYVAGGFKPKKEKAKAQ